MPKAAKPVANVTVIKRCMPLTGGLVYSCDVRYPLQVRQTSVPVTLQLKQSDTGAMLPKPQQPLQKKFLTPAHASQELQAYSKRGYTSLKPCTLLRQSNR